MPFSPHLDLSDPLIHCLVRILHSSIRNRDAEGVVVDTPSDADITGGAILSSPKKEACTVCRLVRWLLSH